MRITQGMMAAHQVARLQTRLERFERAQSQLGTGKAILQPSDDPAAANRGMVLRASRRAREQEARNATDAITWLNLADSKLQSAVGRLHRARDLVVSAASSQDRIAREAMALEVAEVRGEIVAIANTEHAGRPLFGGYGAEPPVIDGNGTWSLRPGSDGEITRRVGENDVVRVNVTVAETFGLDPADPGGDVFTLLDDIDTAMRAGDQQAIADTLDRLDSALERIGSSQASIGAATNRVDAALVRNQEDQLTIRSELAVTEDVDIASAVMELQTQEVAYQATLAALSRVLQPSLVDFLR